MASAEAAQKRKRAKSDDGGLGGLYDFLPAPDPENDSAAKVKAAKKEKPKLPTEDRSKVIFLDIDGVLLPAGSVETIVVDGVSMPIRERMSESDFPAGALDNLRRVIERTGAILVLSSEWRRTASMRDYLGCVFRGRDVPQTRDNTPVFKPRPDLDKYDPAIVWCDRRAREIGAWLKQHPEVTAYVAIDDLDFNWSDSVRQHGTPQLKPRSVWCDPHKCLTEDGAEQAVQLLLNPPVLSEEQLVAATAASVQATQEALMHGVLHK